MNSMPILLNRVFGRTSAGRVRFRNMLESDSLPMARPLAVPPRLILVDKPGQWPLFLAG
jgi:hypothetical protein